MPVSIPAMRSKPLSPVTPHTQPALTPASTHELWLLSCALNARRLLSRTTGRQHLS